MPLEYLGAPPVASDRQARPFSPAVRAGDFIYVSGQVPANADGEIVVGGIERRRARSWKTSRRCWRWPAPRSTTCARAPSGCRTRATLVPSTASTWLLRREQARALDHRARLMVDAKVEIDVVAYKPSDYRSSVLRWMMRETRP